MRIQGAKELWEYKVKEKLFKYKELRNYENTRNQVTMRIQGAKELWEYKEPRKYENTRSQGTTGKPLIKNTSTEFIKCRILHFW